MKTNRSVGRSIILLVTIIVLLVPIASSEVAAAGPNSLLQTYFDVGEAATQNGTGHGENYVRIANPFNRVAVLAPNPPVPMCAMIYVFNNQTQMGACCGCPVFPQSYLSIRVQKELISDWPTTLPSPESGTIAVLAAAPNVNSCTGHSTACNLVCDPTASPGFTASGQLNGYILHNQAVGVPDIPEVPMASEDSGSDGGVTPTYLQGQCSLITSHGTTGICSCGPTLPSVHAASK